jgi:hypothetical protein
MWKRAAFYAGVLGYVPAIWQAIKFVCERVFRWGEHIEFAFNRAHDIEYVGTMLAFLLDPPAWFGAALIVPASALIWLGLRRPISLRREPASPRETPSIASTSSSVAAKPLPDATVKWAFHHLCALANLDAAKDDTTPIWMQLRQAARDSKITVWGRPESGTLSAPQFIKPVEMVPPDHWRDYDFDVLRCLAGNDDTSFARTEPDDERKHSLAKGYADLWLNAEQIRHLAVEGDDRPVRIPLTQVCQMARAIIGLDMSEHTTELLDFTHALRQAGSDGLIQFFGHELPNGRGSLDFRRVARTHPLIEIPKERFRDHWFDFVALLKDDNFSTMTYTIIGSPLLYTNIHANREQSERWLKREARHMMNSVKAART